MDRVLRTWHPMILVAFLTGLRSISEAQPPPEPGVLSGSIVDEATQHPLAMVPAIFQVLPHEDDYSVLRFRISTDAEGRYHLSELGPGDYDLIVVVPDVGYVSLENLHVEGDFSRDLLLIPSGPNASDGFEENERARWQAPVPGKRLFALVRQRQARALGKERVLFPAFEAMRAAGEWILRHPEIGTEEQPDPRLQQIRTVATRLLRFFTDWGATPPEDPLSPIYLDLLALRILEMRGCREAAGVGMEAALRSAEKGLPQAVPVFRAQRLGFLAQAGQYHLVAAQGMELLRHPQLPLKALVRLSRYVTAGVIRHGPVPELIATLEEIVARPVSRQERRELLRSVEKRLLQLHWARGHLERAREMAPGLASPAELNLLTSPAPSRQAQSLPRLGKIQHLERGFRGGGRLSPDGGHVVYRPAEAPGTLQVQPLELGAEPYHFGGQDVWSNPVWSPDGTRLAWTEPVALGGQGPREGREVHLCVADFASREARTVGEPVRMPLGPLEWFPDSRTLLFSAFVAPMKRYTEGDTEWYAGQGQVCMLDVDNGELRTITNGEHDDGWAVLRPQGDLIAFERQRYLWVMKADGTEQRPLTEGKCGQFQPPQWSPDGQAIAFLGEDPHFGGGLWIAELESGRLSKVASRAILGFVGGEASCWTWRPDSQGLLFCSGEDLFVTERSFFALPRLLALEEGLRVEFVAPTGPGEQGLVLVETSDGQGVMTWKTEGEKEPPPGD